MMASCRKSKRVLFDLSVASSYSGMENLELIVQLFSSVIMDIAGSRFVALFQLHLRSLRHKIQDRKEEDRQCFTISWNYK